MGRTLNFADQRLAAVVLAAGGSSRLGHPKQLLRYRGTPLLLRSTRLASGIAGAGVVVVLGHGRLRLRRMLNREPRHTVVVNNPRWQEGLATSLRAGIRSVPRTATAALIVLVDQARLDAADLARLAACWRRRPGRPAAAWYLGHAGAPAVIPRRWFRKLAGLNGDIGARKLLRQLGELSLVGMPSAGFDIDTPADAEALSA